MIEEFVMYRWMIVCLLCLILAVPLYAQDDTHTPYNIALQLIKEAAESCAEELDLSHLGLTEVPQEIGQLTNLQVLYLQHNHLMGLPAEIGQLTNLRALFLGANQLTSLPSEIGQLTNLQALNLFNAQLTSLPSEIGQLTELQFLNLGENQLQHLPTEMSNLTNLTCSTCRLSLDNNPLISPPEVVEQGTAAVLAYLRNQAWYHTQRLIISVAGGVGLFALLVLGFRWKQRGGRKLKQKRG